MRASAAVARVLVGCGMMVALTACMSLSRPFYGPGEEGKRLVAILPPPRLAVPPMNALFKDHEAALRFARAMTHALAAQSLPAVTKVKGKYDWWLDMSSAPSPFGIVPRFTVVAPDGKPKGHVDVAGIARAGWETLSTEQITQVTRDAAPRIAALLTGIQAEAMMADPQSLKRRAALVNFLGVKNAPGDGNITLSRSFLAVFPDQRNQLTTVSTKADFTVEGQVHLSSAPKSPSGHDTQVIEIVWRVRDHSGKEAGAATQLHDIQAGALDHAWGDVAMAAAQEAAGAVRQIITAYSGRNHQPLPKGAH